MIDPSIRAVLRSRYTIRRFFLIYGLCLAVAILSLLLIAHAFPSDHWFRLISKDFLINLAAVIAVFMTTYAFYLFVTPPGLRNAEVIPLRDVEISDEIIDLLKEATDYWFWGRSGSYFRSEILPRLDQIARTERRRIRIRLVLPDPSRPENCLRYKQILTGLNEFADDNTLAANVTATIVMIANLCSRNPYLDAEVGLCATVPTLRYDLSNNGALLTRDAKKLPALLTNSGNAYFEMFRDAVESELSQSKKVTWSDKEISATRADELDLVLRHVRGLPDQTVEIIDAALELVNAGRHRYARA
jgi:hypothetical protein